MEPKDISKCVFSEQDWENFAQWLKGILTVDVATVTFTKKDGTERVMQCTLKPDLLPKTDPILSENKKEKKSNPKILAVYDLEANGWRSFTIKSIKSVYI